MVYIDSTIAIAGSKSESGEQKGIFNHGSPYQDPFDKPS
tara:strand:- start:1772 stop:1888 length:117 start_codon:yes stop_codon:yes gene_type:complete